MSEGELVFSDGSSFKGSYRILFTSSMLRKLIFVSNDFSTDFFRKDADFLRALDGDVVAKALRKTNVGAKNQVLTVTCEFQYKE